MLPASVPPPSVLYRLRDTQDASVSSHPLNPLDFLLRAAQVYPDKVALVHPNVQYPVQYTFATWAQRIQNLAYALLYTGIKPGDRVAVIAPNSPLIADAHHGVIAARAILTPINTRLKPSEVAYILDHSGASLILVDFEFVHLLPKDINIPVVISKDTGRHDDPYEEFLSKGRQFSQERSWGGLDAEPDENAAAVLCYTMTRDSVYLWILPMFHAAGWTFPWASVFSFAKQITLRTVNYTHIWQHIIESGVSHYCGAPTVQIGIVNDPQARKLPQPVRAVIAGAAPTAHLIEELEKLGFAPVHVYGLTSSLPLAERARFMARQGHAFATAQGVRVVFAVPDEEKNPVLRDVPRDGKTMGEIVTKGNIVMKEYFRDPEATRKAFRGGYFKTGDLAVMNPDGSIAILDRSKDIIISGGENASSLAIEQELTSHPHVLEVSVVARLHPKWGERPMAFVLLHPQHAAKWAGRHHEFGNDLKNHAKARLPGFACPEWIEVVPDLPKTSTGKILKSELRKIVAKL
ncbi:hypothetical protein AGABI1DRAFT_31483 [Agaricus bisporus var. burnettii JB137-S8]|uniref:AMP-dependent synthetase/ligase domain-containing protein n=2 Tax=Agaricus bisporus var. burnettii TaxID=192524 RepID=K5X790_AGABU|nr:uncharacterized protein AGABI1DRAFT_31483 [Agaricus bisporus var. burnettii JB137-S8]EKM83756.1 hypothetical protein AGABI1DRAFT_31483 [Agaricus bisporus var. burnettii JB137-S8]